MTRLLKVYKGVFVSLALLVLIAGLAPTASANTITVTPTPVISGAGPYTWTYGVFLSGNSRINTGDFFSIFDFAGYVAGSIGTAMAGWAGTTANTIPVCPNGVAAVCANFDDAAVTNLLFTYTGPDIIGPGAGATVMIGTVFAQSQFNTAVNDWFVSQDDDLQTGSNNEGAAGNTNVPVAQTVPEPNTLLLLGAGLISLGLARRQVAR